MDQDYYQQEINRLLDQYKQKRTRELYTRCKDELDAYQLDLQNMEAPKRLFDWVNTKRRSLNQLNTQAELKAGQSNESPKPLTVGLEITAQLKDEVDQALGRVEKKTAQAVQISNYIKVQLASQIEQLDEVYEQNKQLQSRLKRVRAGLIVLLRRAMLNKLTRCLAILLVLAVIGLIVVIVLKQTNIL